MSSSPAAGAVECEEGIAILRASDGCERLAEALVPYSTVLGFAHQFARSLEALREARDLLEPAVHGWLLAAHDLMVAWNLLALGRPEDAERAARSSLKGFDLEGEMLVVVSALNALASIAEARGDLDAASAAYEELLERCRDTEQPLHVPLSLAALAALRAREGDDHAADRLYGEAIGRSFNPWLSADAMIGQAAVARRLGDLARAGELLDAAASLYRHIELPAGPPRVLVGLAWWALAAGHPDDATAFAAEAAQAATASGDPASELLANTAMAAVKAVATPTPQNVEAFVALAQQRSAGPGYRSLTDEPDVAELLARLGGG
jgi:tetratricopeptide (TPR) repeat protein